MTLHHLSTLDILWLILGFAGQALFGMRILIQWIHSEKQRKSVVPLGFWWLSIVASICLLIYAIHLRDPVILSGQLFGAIVYVRNIWLIYSERKAQQAPLSAPVS
jgi:lipid-A-disaccharide synthase-like uncharacterized protein